MECEPGCQADSDCLSVDYDDLICSAAHLNALAAVGFGSTADCDFLPSDLFTCFRKSMLSEIIEVQSGPFPMPVLKTTPTVEPTTLEPSASPTTKVPTLTPTTTLALTGAPTRPPYHIVDLLVNGHFDDKEIPGKPYMFNDTKINGWTAVHGGMIELWGSGAYGIQSHTNTGTYTYIELDVQNDATLDGVYQDVATTKGSIYLLTFYMRARHEAHRLTDSEALNVEWNGESLGRFVSTEPNAWTEHQLTVIGTGGLDRLAFVEVSSSGEGPLLDDVSLYESLY